MTMKQSRRGVTYNIYNRGITKMKQMSDVMARVGTVTLSGGSATVNTTRITENSLVFLTAQEDGVNKGFVFLSTIAPGASFTIKSSNASDDRSVAYFIVEG